MKSRVILIITTVSLIFTIIFAFWGLKVFGIEIFSIESLKNKNIESDTLVTEANRLVEEEYPKTADALEDSYSEYEKIKKQYNELVEVTDENKKNTYETKQYDISYLWKKLGTYAYNRSLWLGISVKKNNNALYDFEFNIKGDYTDVINFITDIENDSEFYFRIYNFRMVNSSATFTVKDINIDPETINN